MHLKLPTIGSFQTVDGIKFQVRPIAGVSHGIGIVWDGGTLGGKVEQTAPTDTPYRYRAGTRVFRSFMAAALYSINAQAEAYADAKLLVARYDNALASKAEAA